MGAPKQDSNLFLWYTFHMEGYRPNTQENIDRKEQYKAVWEAVKDRPINEAREMVAMAYDLRPVAEIQADVDAVEEKELMEKLETFKKAGFFVESYDHGGESDQPEAKRSLTFFISKDMDLAQEDKRLTETWEKPPSKEFHIRYGQLMGFPQTAIDAYIERDCLSQEEREALGFPKDYEDGPSVIPFGISRKHYAEETAYLKKYFKALIEVFPVTYGTNLSGETLDTYKKEVEAFLNKDFSPNK